MAAVEPVLQVNTCLANNIIRPHEIVVHHHDTQFCLQRERHREFKHPGRYESDIQRLRALDSQRLLDRTEQRVKKMY